MDQLININLRESNRADVAFIVAVKSAWVSEKSGLHISRDISKKGVFILAGPPREIDADLKMGFSSPKNGFHITRFGENYYGWIDGRVIRVEDEGYAVQFEEEYQLTIPQDSLDVR